MTTKGIFSGYVFVEQADVKMTEEMFRDYLTNVMPVRKWFSNHESHLWNSVLDFLATITGAKLLFSASFVAFPNRTVKVIYIEIVRNIRAFFSSF